MGLKEYEQRRTKEEIEGAIARRLAGRAKTAYDWIPRGINRSLDIGSSWTLLRSLPKVSEYVYSVDIDESKISEARKWYPDVNFILSNVENLCFKDNAFDLITILDTLEHVDNDQMAIEEAFRILKPGGILILSVPHAGSFAFLDPDNLIFIKLYKLMNRFRILQIDSYYLKKHRHYRMKDIEKLFAGKFKLTKVYRGGLFLTPLINLLSKLISLLFIYTGKPRQNFIRQMLKPIDKVKDFDYNIDYGNMGYHMCLMAIKVPNDEQ